MSDNEAFNKCTTDAASRSGERFATSFYTMQAMYVQAQARVYELEAALREIMEVSDQKSYGFAFSDHAVYFRMARAALTGEKKDGSD